MAEGGLVPDWLQSLLLLASLGILAYLMVKQASEAAKMTEQEEIRAYTEIECADGSRKTREFHSGDYVGGEASDCPQGRVIGIYAVKPEKGKSRKRGPIALPAGSKAK